MLCVSEAGNQSLKLRKSFLQPPRFDIPLEEMRIKLLRECLLKLGFEIEPAGRLPLDTKLPEKTGDALANFVLEPSKPKAYSQSGYFIMA